MDWRLKALAFRVLEVPGGAQLHYSPRHPQLAASRAQLDSLDGVAQRVVDDAARHGGAVPSTVLEVGAGRDLAVPLALRQLGVARVIASDVERLARLDLVQHAAARC
jgi:hypothetical protein